VVRRELLVRLQSVLRLDQGEIIGNFSVPSGLNDCPSCATFCGGFNEIASIEIFTAQCDEQFAGLKRARISADLLNDNHTVYGRKTTAGKLRNLRERKTNHCKMSDPQRLRPINIK